MSIFNIYLSGYNLGHRHAILGERHRAIWELLLFNPITWLPGVDRISYINGYATGYHDSLMMRSWMRQVNSRLGE